MAEKLIRCSFCGKTQAQVKRIMSGPNAYICNECVELCSTILHEEMYETGSSELAVPDHLPTPKEIKEYMDGYIIGQDEAVHAVAAAIRRGRVGISPKRKPVSFIFVGSTGVGKTELVKQLAQDLFNAPESLIRLDMSEFMEKYAVSRIIGSPPGYVG